jgi:transposase-like protein
MTDKETVSTQKPDPEVKAPVYRRTFSREEKLRILEEADACERGEVGALLRREEIYSSHLSRWRKARYEGTLTGTLTKRRGPQSDRETARDHEVEALRRENQRLRTRLQQAETVIEVQKKLSQLLGLEPTPPEQSGSK